MTAKYLVEQRQVSHYSLFPIRAIRPRIGPNAKTVKTISGLKNLSIKLIHCKLTIVIENPIQFIMVSADPLDSSAAF